MASHPTHSPALGAHAEPDAPAIVPFWHRLNSFFLFPFQREPLVYAVVLALSSFLLLWPSGLIQFFIALGILLAASRYAFKVAALASLGVLHSQDYTPSVIDPDWKVLPWKFFAILVVHGLVIGWVGSLGEWLGVLANAASSLVLPATLMVLIQSLSIRTSLNPFELLATMTGIGWSYLLLCLFLFLLMAGFPTAFGVLEPVVPDWLLLPLVFFLAVYFLWVMASLTGYVMFQHHAALDIDLLKEPDADATGTSASPVRTEAQVRDAAVARLIQAGDLSEALGQAYEWKRTAALDSVADHRRYHRVLRLSDKPDTLLTHAQDFIPMLVKAQRGPEALEVWQTCQQVRADFSPADANVVLALAQQAWKLRDAKLTLTLIKGYDKRFTGNASIPEAYELMVRVLKQGLHRPDKALPIYHAMQRHYPSHASTQEAAWLLREDLGPTPT
ncbi:MAG: hypothetical protein ACTS5V_05890 [Giesbergeria sp.]